GASERVTAATDLVELLVRLVVRCREAHGTVSGLVRAALKRGATLSELSAEELAAHSPGPAAHGDEVKAALSQGAWLKSKISEGGTSPARVREQLRAARRALDAGTAA